MSVVTGIGRLSTDPQRFGMGIIALWSKLIHIEGYTPEAEAKIGPATGLPVRRRCASRILARKGMVGIAALDFLVFGFVMWPSQTDREILIEPIVAPFSKTQPLGLKSSPFEEAPDIQVYAVTVIGTHDHFRARKER
jgi:hypothetical protein